MTLHRSFFEAEEEAVQPEDEAERDYTIEEIGVEKVEFRDRALDDLKKLQQHLRTAKSPQDVVRTALEVLALALDKEITIEGGGKRWKIRNLWRSQR